jgi:hypothetical protein
MRVDYTCIYCEDLAGFIHVASGMICESCKQKATPVQMETVMSVLWRGQQEQIVELDKMFALEAGV